jgi:hypothetical protein
VKKQASALYPKETLKENKISTSAQALIVMFLTVQNKSNLNLWHICVFSPASAKRGRVRFLAWLIEDKETKRVLNLEKQGSSALGTANLTLIKTLERFILIKKGFCG